ncbi:hypothetical protein DL766_007723 [Monosporascus sp. MC13-8B]|uniref:Oxidoreductase-like protein n=1 Tax=Monosporascus cannonballus TaxID=155416 RepID=A0ABY0H0P6_9PEZI|nr:hypothetical protein DL762_007252 [Monosporascus cannonballus]RYO84832.1 hypothetical protein DL763_007342 [Monosporascus cannonballus]RYP22486.1 hypothetical protein DL766_007723 [Monosporascus sp. MC13-8B]
MAEQVEARSLADLNYLAANPPQYPTNPAEKRQDPLTLYISRVPGTRDVILSTFKPQVKDVTVEDIASSLYYVHFDTPTDDLLVPAGQARSSSSPRSSSESRSTQIQRKPLPSSAKLAELKDTLVDPATHTTHPALRQDDSGRGAHVQQPVPQANTHLNPTTPPQRAREPSTGAIQRKPLGPRPITNIDSTHKDSPPTTSDEQPPALPPRPDQQQNIPGQANFQPPPASHSVSSKHSSRPPSPAKKTFKPFSLTLIRRDRSSGEQWNVGKIASFQLMNPDQLEEDKHYQPSPTILIHILTSGYAKFRGMPTRPTLGSGSGDIRSSFDTRPRSAGAISVSRLGEERAAAQGIFERQVRMAYSPSWTANLRRAFDKRRKSVSASSPTSPVRGSSHGRHNSAASAGSSAGGDFDFGDFGGGDAGPVITQPAPGLKPRGYTFTSPWDGRCEFVTGNGGRSLRCRHILPNYSGNVFNPLASGGEGGGDGEHQRSSSSSHHYHRNNKAGRAVSELRFNIPTSELFKERDKRVSMDGARTRDQIGAQLGQQLDQFQRLVKNATAGATHNKSKGGGYYSSDDDYDPDWRLDMSLGREKAGGGKKGSRAKMGKLIVAEDGLKMLDLVVAANVGIWWTAWERTLEDDPRSAP